MIVAEKKVVIYVKVRGYSQTSVEDRIYELSDRLKRYIPTQVIRCSPLAESDDRRPVGIITTEVYVD